MENTTLQASALPPEVATLYPFEGRHLQLDCGHRMHYLDEGAGTPLLMLHGNPTWSFYWRNLVLGLRDRYRCIVPDHIGCGLSDKPQGWSYTVPAHADNICELVTKLDLLDITVVVHDWGGAIGYLAAMRHAERFRRFVVFNSTVFLLPLPRLLTVMGLPLFGSLFVRGLNGMLRAGLATSIVHRERFTPAVRAGYMAPYDSWANRIAILRFIEEIPLTERHANRGLLSELDRGLATLRDRPHLVMWGTRDRVFHRGYLDGWRKRFPSAEFHEFDDASHWVVEEVPDRILPLMERFLAQED